MRGLVLTFSVLLGLTLVFPTPAATQTTASGSLGVDLQKRVHEDMRHAFARYPRNWGLRRPDPNIDHRRVPNLQVFLARHGRKLRASRDPTDYRAGDLVTWMVSGNLPHIGIVTDRRSTDGKRPLIVHNIG